MKTLREKIEAMDKGDFYIAYGKFLNLESRYQSAVLAMIDWTLKTRRENNER